MSNKIMISSSLLMIAIAILFAAGDTCPSFLTPSYPRFIKATPFAANCYIKSFKPEDEVATNDYANPNYPFMIYSSNASTSLGTANGTVEY